MKTMRQMMIAVIAGSLLVLVACGDMGPEANRGTLNNALPLSPISNAATSVVFKTAFTSNTATAPVVAALQTLNAGANALPCDFTVYKINYNTVGALGEAATATAAVMVPVPTNGNSNCAGPGYPVILAAHGTDINRSSDVSKVSSHLEGSLYATIFASQGYVVIAPNYAGYDDSNLNYHPYLILNQQVKDMRDALTAAGKAGVYVGNGKLYLTGYSQGGAVALATQRALESEGVSFSASAPNSGPYAMLSFGDAIFGGQPNRGGTVFAPLLIDATQKAYGNIYQSPLDIYSSTNSNTTTPYSSFVVGLLPYKPTSDLTNLPALKLANLLPPVGSESGVFGIGTNALFTDQARQKYNADAASYPVQGSNLPTILKSPLRQALLNNDLRSGWVPSKPTQLCGASNDPTVYFTNTSQFKAYADAKSASRLSVLDLNEAAVLASDGAVKYALKTQYQSALGGTQAMAYLVTDTTKDVHANMAPFCYLASLNFFRGN